MQTWKSERLVFVDTETTGLDSKTERIIELGWIVTDHGHVVEQHNVLLQPDKKLTPKITEITGITDAMLEGCPPFHVFANGLLDAIDSAAAAVAYNAPFDEGFLADEIRRASIAFVLPTFIDPLVFVRHFDKFMKGKRLTQVCSHLQITAMGDAHRALVDCLMCSGVLEHYMPRLPDDLDELFELQAEWRDQQERDYQAYKARMAR